MSAGQHNLIASNPTVPPDQPTGRHERHVIVHLSTVSPEAIDMSESGLPLLADQLMTGATGLRIMNIGLHVIGNRADRIADLATRPAVTEGGGNSQLILRPLGALYTRGL